MRKIKLTMILSLAFLIFINLSNVAYAASDQLNLPTNSEPASTPMPSVFSLFLKLIVAIVVVGILGYYTLKFLRKSMQSSSIGDSITILDQQTLGVNKGIYITEIANRVYVLGVTDHNINVVTEIIEQDTIENMRKKAAQRQEEPIVPANITSLLKNILQNISMRTNGNQGEKDFKSHIQAQVKNLQKIFDKGREEEKDDQNL